MTMPKRKALRPSIRPASSSELLLKTSEMRLQRSSVLLASTEAVLAVANETMIQSRKTAQSA